MYGEKEKGIWWGKGEKEKEEREKEKYFHHTI